MIFSPAQASASALLASMEKERELLRIFLKVSQMENTILRRMNLSSFLMVTSSIMHAAHETKCEPVLFLLLRSLCSA